MAQGWTVSYRAWWISWTPFVGRFIARISRGRSIKQFVTGVTLIPSAVSLVRFIVAMVLVAIFFVSGADAASIVMGTLSQRGTIEPSRWVVVFRGVVMGAIAIIMLIVSPGDEALQGLQNIWIIMAAPFAVVRVALCVALTQDLRSDPPVRRDDRAAAAAEQAVEYGTQAHGDEFVIAVRPRPEDQVLPGRMGRDPLVPGMMAP